MRQSQKLPTEIGTALDSLTKSYSESKATTEAGRILRFIARIIPLSTVLKIIVHKNK